FELVDVRDVYGRRSYDNATLRHGLAESAFCNAVGRMLPCSTSSLRQRQSLRPSPARSLTNASYSSSTA
ncbi:MAG: hypothetical protein AAFR88_07330, partial [Pseudomonadota bacterium]